VWRDWALVTALVTWSVLEALLREGLAWSPLALLEGVVVALSLLWRRTHPLPAVVAAFSVLTVVDVMRIVALEDAGRLWSVAAVLVLPYALFRWGSGREAAVGLGFVLVWLGVPLLADSTDVAEVVAGYGFFLFAAALGTSIRLHANARVRDIEQARLRQRGELARELHDIVGHHVSAIVIQAQAGRVLSATDPERAAAVLQTIEEAASRRGNCTDLSPSRRGVTVGTFDGAGNLDS
jgi:signal transduction histidine kinase